MSLRILPHLCVYIASILCIVGCSSVNKQSDYARTTILRMIPFQIDSLYGGSACYRYACTGGPWQFICNKIENYAPDYCLNKDKSVLLMNMYHEMANASGQKPDGNVIWRNIFFNKRHKRMLCVDRIVDDGKTKGYIYVLESEQKHTLYQKACSWDIMDMRNVESVGAWLDDARERSMQKLFVSKEAVQAPLSQDDYWRLIWHADSTNNLGEMIKYYDVAFSVNEYILPVHLSMVAERMLMLGEKEKYEEYLRHRIKMEPDFYGVDNIYLPEDMNKTYQERNEKYKYDLILKDELERMYESDQRYRLQWQMADNEDPNDTVRINKIFEAMWNTDQTNLPRIKELLTNLGHYPTKVDVGELATITPWLVIQHADLDTQVQYLPMLKDAAAKGIIKMQHLAMLLDRIDVGNGKPQKYGTQYGPDNKLCPLLDKSKVNEWRREVGLPPLSF